MIDLGLGVTTPDSMIDLNLGASTPDSMIDLDLGVAIPLSKTIVDFTFRSETRLHTPVTFYMG